MKSLANKRLVDQPDAGALIPGFEQVAREAVGHENAEIRKPDRYRIQRDKKKFKQRKKVKRSQKKYSRKN
jgi:hypothetical protein